MEFRKYSILNDGALCPQVMGKTETDNHKWIVYNRLAASSGN